MTKGYLAKRATRATGRAGALRDWLSARLEEDVVIENVSSPSVGYSAENVLFDLRRPERGHDAIEGLVARIDPPGVGISPWVDSRSHFRVLEELGKTDLPVPRVWLYASTEESPFDQSFFLMEKVDGRIPPENPPYVVRGWLKDAGPDFQYRVFCHVVEQIGRVHAVDWTRLDLDFMPAVAQGRPGMAAELESLKTYAKWVIGDRDDEAVWAAFTILEASIPPTDRLCLNWGDAKLSNIVFQQDRPVALLDWELATIAPPEYDMSFFLVYHRLMAKMSKDDLAGFPGEESIINLYEKYTGYRLNNMDWFGLLHSLRLDLFSRRLTDLLIETGRLPASSEATPHVLPRRLLAAAMDDFKRTEK